MKFSNSILIFLFFSSVSGAFFYALHRTNGNVFKSLQFALYFLAIKMGLIPLSLPFELNQDQPNQQLLSRVNKVESPGYHPYLSLYNDYCPSGLLMDSIERSSSVPQYSYSQNAITELRAGSSRVREAAWLLITIWMLQQQSVGFQPVRPVARPPHVKAAQNLLFGKPKPEQFLLTKNRNTNCSRQRFEELCRDQKTGRIDFSSIDEALGLLEAEGRGFVEGGYRTEKDVIDADFGIKGPHPYDLADVKTPINWGKGNEDLEAAAERMGKKIKQQRSRMQNYGKRLYILWI
nr:hypothetical protein orf290b [Schizostauron trachyderma]